MNPKVTSIRELFNPSDRILVAFSGGVDSSYLLYALNTFNHAKVGAVTVKTPYIPDWELEEAKSFCDKYGIEHTILELGIPEEVKTNPVERCYLCKKKIFGEILLLADSKDYNIVADGTNSDDSGTHRPGMKALSELGIMSPLKEAGLSKDDIRKLSANEGLKTWDKPSYACLLTRLPYDTNFNEDVLKKIEAGEHYIHNLGFGGARLRYHDPVARIECDPVHFEGLINKKSEIIDKLKSLEFRYITIDLEGYRSGSMDQ